MWTGLYASRSAVLAVVTRLRSGYSTAVGPNSALEVTQRNVGVLSGGGG
jgi:hypothetical protein